MVTQKYNGTVDSGKHGKNIRHFFLDSGAFTLWTKNVIELNNPGFYDSKEFWQYVDSYARFIKHHKDGIDYYANVDVIGDAERTYEVQKYMERKHKLSPVPAVHYGTEDKWLDTYLREGYKYIGFGGMAKRKKTTSGLRVWLDRMFEHVCPKSNGRKPIINIHGFGVTSFDMLVSYPWYSVDSTSYITAAGFGMLLMPRRENGEFVWSKPPYTISVSEQMSAKLKQGAGSLGDRGLRRTIKQWLKYIGIPYGKSRKNENGELEVVEAGVINNRALRTRANVYYYYLMNENRVPVEVFIPGREPLDIFDVDVTVDKTKELFDNASYPGV